MGRNESEEYCQRCVVHHLMNNVHGAHILFCGTGQGVFGFEHNEALELDDDDHFHHRVRENNKRTAEMKVLNCVGGCGDDRWVLQLALSHRHLCRRCVSYAEGDDSDLSECLLHKLWDPRKGPRVMVRELSPDQKGV